MAMAPKVKAAIIPVLMSVFAKNVCTRTYTFVGCNYTVHSRTL